MWPIYWLIAFFAVSIIASDPADPASLLPCMDTAQLAGLLGPAAHYTNLTLPHKGKLIKVARSTVILTACDLKV